MDSYVVRIYRRDRQTLTGLVESVDTRTSEPFHSAEELWAILINARSCPRKVSSTALGSALGEDLQVFEDAG